jgi:hypothetical protein
MKKLFLAVALSVAASACIGFEHKSSVTEPGAAGLGALMGTWTSANIIPSPTTCTDFRWTPSEQTNTTAKGAFSATCAGDLRLTGTAEGALTTSGGITWSAQGNATAPGLTSCGIALTGTAELTTDSIRIPYQGNTCLGAVNGVEVLRRN